MLSRSCPGNKYNTPGYYSESVELETNKCDCFVIKRSFVLRHGRLWSFATRGVSRAFFCCWAKVNRVWAKSNVRAEEKKGRCPRGKQCGLWARGYRIRCSTNNDICGPYMVESTLLRESARHINEQSAPDKTLIYYTFIFCSVLCLVSFFLS
ncbi:hypothetical protein AVEN_89185-1 [Araneus ventricosus]|uniref:Uncharacterized protein n=1 Tax=Araneus ventricosus TaxID=182803 RepID=A0A4Y2B4C1_ARAVE|nr:hypothetical protein AVEN_89185-1 [Araneus ventricosus]